MTKKEQYHGSSTLVEGSHYRVVGYNDALNELSKIEIQGKSSPNFRGVLCSLKLDPVKHYVIHETNDLTADVLECYDNDLIEYYERIQEYRNCLEFATHALFDVSVLKIERDLKSTAA